MKNKALTKAVSYLRCSGLGQAGGDTWDRQSAAIAKYAKQHGLEVRGRDIVSTVELCPGGADWGALLHVHDDRAIFQALPDELPSVDIHSLRSPSSARHQGRRHGFMGEPN